MTFSIFSQLLLKIENNLQFCLSNAELYVHVHRSKSWRLMQTSSRQFLSQHGFGIVSFCLDDDMDASFFGIDITSKSPFFTHPHIRLRVVSAAVFPLGIMGELR